MKIERAVKWLPELVLVVATAAGAVAQTPAGKPAAGAVAVQMRNVFYHFTPPITITIRELDGMLVPTHGELPVFDDKKSFYVDITRARFAISADSLQHLLNDKVFAAPDAPLKRLVVSFDNGKIKIKGKMHQHGDLSFETEGNLSVTADGKIRVHAEKIKALHMQLKGVMDLVGAKISGLMKTQGVAGVSVEGDDILLDEQKLLPQPEIRGRLASVSIVGNNLEEHFGSAKGPAAKFHGNYMAYSGEKLRFGKLTMSNTDMILIDMDPGDPFDFYLDQYQRQLTAGYTKITPQNGLRVYMRDFNKLGGIKK